MFQNFSYKNEIFVKIQYCFASYFDQTLHHTQPYFNNFEFNALFFAVLQFLFSIIVWKFTYIIHWYCLQNRTIQIPPESFHSHKPKSSQIFKKLNFYLQTHERIRGETNSSDHQNSVRCKLFLGLNYISAAFLTKRGHVICQWETSWNCW